MRQRVNAPLSFFAVLAAALIFGLPDRAEAIGGLDAPQTVAPFLNGVFPTTEPNGTSQWAVQETYTGININLPMHVLPYPGTSKLLCVAKEGRIFLFDDVAGASQVQTFLDLRNSGVFTSSDSGMSWLVFHPQFGQAGSPNRGYVYVTYKWAPATGGDGSEAYWRLSRFTVQDGTQVADPASEQILVQQYDRQQWHDSGCMVFGPDGYLYWAIGDEGGANDQYNDGQKINDRLFSGIMRVDVDQNLTRSHPIRRQPNQLTLPAGWPNSFTANYTIPNDNPFVDAGGGNLEEFYALGVRQPYRFSYDSVSNRFWIGESGQDTREELDLLTPGANYGWPFREGIISRPTGPQPPAQPATLIGTLTEPIWDASHATDSCVVGGFVYRGAKFPSLVGKFITVDNVSGHIRAFDYDTNTGKATNTLLTDMPSGSVYSGTSTIGRDGAGEPIFVKINGTGARGRFFKLASVPPVTAKAGLFHFDDQAAANSSGYVSDNPGNLTKNQVLGGVSLLVNDDETTTSSNVYYTPGSGLVPNGATVNSAGVRSIAAGDVNGRPGNGAGGLATSSSLGILNDFTVEVSFKPSTGSLGAGYQAFVGLDGTTGNAPNDVENGVPIQPFRLMRWGRTGNGATGLALTNGDLFLNVRSYNPATAAWTSVPIRVLPVASFTANQWVHLAIVGNVSAGTVTVYSYNATIHAYSQIGQASGYIGNMQSGVWSLGRGMYNGGATDYATDATFDEFRIADQALTPAQFLYGTQLWTPTVSEPPPLLSQTGAFSDLATLTPSSALVPYGVNAPLWSDAAAKKRWISLPNDGVHNSASEKIAFKAESNWTFPAGTVFVKHFDLHVDEANPETLRHLETRFVIMPNSGEPYGVTYKWRADGSDADLLPGGASEAITIAEAGGGSHTQTWDYPSRSDCRLCHNGNAGYVLGLNTQQLNGDYLYPLTGRSSNQLETMAALGWFDSGYRADQLPYFLKSRNLADTTADLETRVRSYLDSNCSQCHRPNGVRANFDARYTTALADQGLVQGSLDAAYFDPGDRVIAPGDLPRSIMRTRLGAVGTLQMPPLAKHIADAQAVQVLTEWIQSLATGPGVELAASASSSGPFTVAVHFTQSVGGLTASDFQVTHGTASSLTGSGTDYVLSVTPSDYGVVTVKLPAGQAQNVGGQLNYASKTLTVNVTDSTLVEWLKLDDTAGSTALNSASSGTDGVINSPANIARIPGRIGGAFTFDSTDVRISMANPIPGDFTISFWMRSSQAFPVSNTPSAGAALFNADVSGAANDFVITGTRTGTTDRISFQTGTAGGTNVTLSGATEVSSGQWIHVAVTRVQSSGKMTIYVNGQQDGTVNGSTNLLNGNPTLVIGATPGDAARSYQGDLDQIRLYSRALNPTEISALSIETEPVPAPYDAWLAARLPGLFHLQDRFADPDGDGVKNFGEFAFGGNPLGSDTIPVPFTRQPGGTYQLSFRAHKPPSGTTYVVRVSPDLQTWTNAAPDLTGQTVTDIPDSDYQWVTLTYLPPSGAGNHQFFRVEATEN